MKGPFIKSENSTFKMMRNLLIALLPIILFSFYKNGLSPFLEGKTTFYGLIFPLLFIMIGALTSYLTEAVCLRIFMEKKGEELKQTLKKSFAIFPGLFLSLILPYHTPIPVLILGCVIATFIGKIIYGGFGHNIFNPALIGCLFILTFFGGTIAELGGYLNVSELDAISSATPLTNLSLIDGIGSYETIVEPYGNLWNFFFGTIPGAIGETSSFLCILAYFYLSYKRVIKWKIPVFYIGTVFLLTWLIGNLNGLGIWYPIFQILSGGLFFGAVFMATDPVTSPITSIGQILYAILLGILTVTFRYLTPLPEGVLTSILTMNIFVVILDKIGSRGDGAMKKITIPLLLCVLAAFLSVRAIVNNYQVEDNGTDPNFEILEKSENDEEVTYIVTQKGNGGLITSKLTIKDGIITSFEILEEHETEAYFAIVEKASYIENLLKKQENLEDVDTISGATISSRALKKTIMNVLKDYEVTK